jgi:hypothetical protein
MILQEQDSAFKIAARSVDKQRRNRGADVGGEAEWEPLV